MKKNMKKKKVKKENVLTRNRSDNPIASRIYFQVKKQTLVRSVSGPPDRKENVVHCGYLTGRPMVLGHSRGTVLLVLQL